MDRTACILRMGAPDTFDPAIFEGSSVFPGYRTPQKIPGSMKGPEEQALKDTEAERSGKTVQVFVSRKKARSGLPTSGALDGSGVGTASASIYPYYGWTGCCQRRNR